MGRSSSAALQRFCQHPALALAACAALLLAALSTPSHAQIVHDGTLGRAASLSGPNYTISPADGRVAGQNLFHSFSQFNVAPGQSARFQTTQGITRVIARVTGPAPSQIAGVLACHGDLYLVNPSGIVFSKGAALDVDGSFAAVGAREIRFADASVFAASAKSTPQPTLSTAAPEAFGFLTGPVRVTGTTLATAPRRGLALVGSSVRLHSATVSAPSGRLLLGAGGPDESLAPEADNLVTLTRSGAVTVEANSRVSVDGKSPGRTGAIIRGGSLAITDSTLTSLATSPQSTGQPDTAPTPGPSVDIQVAGAVRIVRGRILGGTTANADGGQIAVRASSVLLQGDGAAAGIFSESQSNATGDAGRIFVGADTITLTSGGTISAASFGVGAGGNLRVEAASDFTAVGSPSAFTGLSVQAFIGSTGPAGTLTAEAGQFNLLGGAVVSGATFGSGHGGDVRVTANSIRLDGPSSSISAASLPGASGDAGFCKLTASGPIALTNGAMVTARTFGTGRAGDLTLQADSIRIDATGPADFTGVSTDQADAQGTGIAGKLTLTARDIQLLNGAIVSAGTFGHGFGGSVGVDADTILIDGGAQPGFTGISLDNHRGSTGTAGRVAVRCADLSLLNGGRISASALGTGDGGDVRILASRSLNIDANRLPFGFTGIAAATFTRAAGGNIVVLAGDVTISRGGQISSSTFAAGHGGLIILRADQAYLVADGAPSIAVNSRSEPGATGAAGDVRITLSGNLIARQSNISARSARNGGNVTITANLIAVSDAVINASARSAAGGGGGNLTLNAPTLALGESAVVATAVVGQGGNITFNEKLFLASRGSLISASSKLGINGSVQIATNIFDLSNVLARPPAAAFHDLAGLVAACHAVIGRAQSTFLAAPRGGTPLSPDGFGAPDFPDSP